MTQNFVRYSPDVEQTEPDFDWEKVNFGLKPTLRIVQGTLPADQALSLVVS